MEEKGLITETEAKQLTKSVNNSDKYVAQGKMFIDLTPFNDILTKKFQEKLEKGELTEKQLHTLHLCRVGNITKPNKNSPSEMAESCEEYIKVMIEDNLDPSVNGLALAIGLSVKEIRDIVSGVIHSPCQQILKNYMQLIATSTEEIIAKGGCAGAMFIGKNYFGMQDAQKIEVEHKKVDLTEEELEDKLKVIDVDSVDIVNDED